MITIFTPTYNRAHLLERAYQSILRQEASDFEWLIVDDGSTDETEQLVQSWITQNPIIPIRYIKKTNGGKHTAINTGVQTAAGELFVILDSDDQLLPDALKLIWSAYQKYKDQNIGGIIGLTSYPDGKIIGTNFPEHEMIAAFADLYYKMGVQGDKSVAFVTDKLKQFPFPEPTGIRFVSELTVWHPLTTQYPVIALNQVIEVKEYMQGGLSNSSYQLWYWQSLAFTNFYLIQQNIHPWEKYPQQRKATYRQLAIYSILARVNYGKQLPTFKDKLYYCMAWPKALANALNIKRYARKNHQ